MGEERKIIIYELFAAFGAEIHDIGNPHADKENFTGELFVRLVCKYMCGGGHVILLSPG